MEAEKLRHKNVSCPLINTRALSSDNTAAGRGGWKEWMEGRIRFISFSHLISSALQRKECNAARLGYTKLLHHLTYISYCTLSSKRCFFLFCIKVLFLKHRHQVALAGLQINCIHLHPDTIKKLLYCTITLLAPNTDICLSFYLT